MTRKVTHMSLEGGVLFFEDGTEVSNISVELIAAAPEMLTALKTMVLHCLHYESMPHASPDAARDVANARAVIRKATGEST